MEDKKLIALVALIVTVVLLGSFFFVLALVKESGDPFLLGKGVALVEMEGVVISEKRMVSQLEDYRKAESVGAIVVRIDSRGAAVVAAHEIYEQIRIISEEGKPVVASLGNIAASGGYYVACGADKIVASPGTITGSIGAVMEFPNAEDLFKKIGLRFETIKSGKYKDIGSATRTMTEDERELLVQVVDDSWEQFISIVSEQRQLPMGEVLKVADGRIISGKRALGLGLIDELGTLQDAIMLAGELAGIEGRPKVIKKKKAFKILDLFGDLLTRLSRTETPFSLEYKATIPY